MRLPKEVRAALDATGLPWAVEAGTRHHKIKLAGHLVGILPKGNDHDSTLQPRRNLISQIKQKQRQLKGETS